MSLLRFLNEGISKLKFAQNLSAPLGNNLINSERYFRKSYGRVLRVMKARRKIIGSDRVRRRNEWNNWNYKAEIFAFAKRLNENITEDTLRSAFMHESYIEEEERKRKKLDIPAQDVQLDVKSNTSLATSGEEITSKFLRKYLTLGYTKLPEEGISALHQYLLSDKLLSYVSYNLGTSDLIYSAEYPPSDSILASVLKAVIGGIAMNDSTSRAENFVLDFICPELIGKDVFEIWDLENPLEVLNEIFERHGLEKCEARLIFESGRNSIESVYCVGLYCNKVFLGKGPGETLDIAIEMAAYSVLRKCFHLRENESPLNFGERAKTLYLPSQQKPPSVLSEWCCGELKSDFVTYLNSFN